MKLTDFIVWYCSLFHFYPKALLFNLTNFNKLIFFLLTFSALKQVLILSYAQVSFPLLFLKFNDAYFLLSPPLNSLLCSGVIILPVSYPHCVYAHNSLVCLGVIIFIVIVIYYYPIKQVTSSVLRLIPFPLCLGVQNFR